MNYSFYQNNSCYIADTSVVINLNATGYATPIIRSTIQKLCITQQVYTELDNGKLSGHNDREKVDVLIKENLVTILSLQNKELSIYKQLITGSAIETLHDGEAATIGCASERNAIIIVDEKKATSICKARFPNIKIISTVDLLLSEEVEKALGFEIQKKSILNALQNARMNIPSDKMNRILTLIGEEAAKQCRTLSKHLRSCKNVT